MDTQGYGDIFFINCLIIEPSDLNFAPYRPFVSVLRRSDFLGMSVADEGSFFSRFTLKFTEIAAAGMATAASGFLIAHVGGFLSSATLPSVLVRTSAPAAVQVVPGVTPPAAPAPIAAEAGDRRPPEHAVHAVPVAPERPVANAAPAEPPRKAAADANAAPGKPRDVARDAQHDAPHDAQRDTPHDSAHDMEHDMESVEAKVRAALAKSDANRPVPHDAPAHPVEIRPVDIHQADTHQADTHQAYGPTNAQMRPPAALPPPQSADAATGTIAPAPRTADIAPPPTQQIPPQPFQQPAQQAPLQPAPPLATVNVQSLPIAGDTAPPPQDSARQDGQENVQANVQASNQTGDQNPVAGFFAAFKKIPDMLRNDKPLPDDQAPRPPMPVDQ